MCRVWSIAVVSLLAVGVWSAGMGWWYTNCWEAPELHWKEWVTQHRSQWFTEWVLEGGCQPGNVRQGLLWCDENHLPPGRYSDPSFRDDRCEQVLRLYAALGILVVAVFLLGFVLHEWNQHTEWRSIAKHRQHNHKS